MRLMKDSGIDYLGDIPVDWDVKPHWAYLKEKKDPVGAMHDQLTLLSLTKRGVIVRDLEAGGKFPSNFEGYQKVEKGDLILCLFDVEETPRTVGLAPSSGMITSAYTNMEVRDIDNRFIEWYLIAMDDEKRFKPFYSGLRNTIPKPIFSSIRFSVPDSLEQKQIADYLDQETSKIDLLISKKEQLIEKLLERRQALIAQVVTKGLDPDVPMKDSGIERLGFVPSNWRVGKLKAAFSRPVRSSGLIKGQASLESATGTFPGYSASGQDVFISKELSIPEHEPGLVLSSVGARCGKTFLAMEESWGLVANTEGWIISEEYDPLYVWLVSQNSELWIRGGSAQPYVQTPLSIANKVPWPNKEVQEAISNYLAAQTGKIDYLANSIDQAIKLLKERRQALITQVVTGKLDVRGLIDGDS